MRAAQEPTFESPPPSGRPSSLGDLSLLFFRLGATAFGGPAAHIAMMEDEIVRRRGWLSREEFLDGENVASLARMAAVTWPLGRSAVRDLPTTLPAVVSALLLLRYRVNSSWLVLAGAAAGLASGFFGQGW